jgi:hypothetical protein
MSEKKMVSRNVAIALGIICIVLVAVIAYFTVTGISAQNSYDNLQNQNRQLQKSLAGNETLLGQTETWLDSNITYYNAQITNLTNQLKNTSPQLGFTNLTAEDNRTNPNLPYLNVKGTIRNFGIASTPYGSDDNAEFWALSVEAYHDDGSVALETTFENMTILSINGESSINVNLNYYYNGSALASWTISLEECFVI